MEVAIVAELVSAGRAEESTYVRIVNDCIRASAELVPNEAPRAGWRSRGETGGKADLLVGWRSSPELVGGALATGSSTYVRIVNDASFPLRVSLR